LKFPFEDIYKSAKVIIGRKNGREEGHVEFEYYEFQIFC
jgi:hypothetical protein